MGMQEALLKAMQGLQGQKDSRGPVGILARGKNMYPGGNAATTGGGPQFGPPTTQPQNPMMQAQLQAMRQQQVGQQMNAAAAPPNPNPQPNPGVNQTQGLGDIGAMKAQQARSMATQALQAAAKRRMMGAQRGNLR